MKNLLLFSFLLSGTFGAFSQANWSKVIAPGGNTWYDQANGVAIDNDGNIYVTGWFRGPASFGTHSLNGFGGNEDDVFVAKYDSTGALIWVTEAGGPNADYGYGIGVDASGNVYITGFIVGSATFGTFNITSPGSGERVFVAKLDPNGNFLSANECGDGYGYSMALDNLGNLYVSGVFWEKVYMGGLQAQSTAPQSVFLVKLDNTGNPAWMKTGSGTDYVSCEGLSVTGNEVILSGTVEGNAMVAGAVFQTQSQEAFAVALDLNGTLVSSFSGKTQGWDGADGYDMVKSGSGNYYFLGNFINSVELSTITLNSTGYVDFFLAKYSPSGSIVWAKNFGGGGSMALPARMVLDSDENIYFTGAFQGSFTIGSITINNSLGSYMGIIAAKLDKDGEVVWLKTENGPQADATFGRDITLDKNNNVWIVGGLEGTMNFDNINVNGGNFGKILIAQIQPGGGSNPPPPIGIDKNEILVSSGIFPNPTEGKVYLNYGKDASKIKEVKIFDYNGRNLFSSKTDIQGLAQGIDLNTLGTAGIYFVQIISETGTLTQRVVLK